MAAFVLVGGAWIGGWAWKPVARDLRHRGHDVYPVTLTGLGERVHLARPETDLETHVADVLNVLTFEDLGDVLLVGHSYAGSVVTGVADRAPDRLSHLVYLDAAPAEDGEAFLDFGPPDAQAATRQIVGSSGGGWRLPVPAVDDLAQQASVAGLDADALDLMQAKAVPQPFGTYTQPLRLTSPQIADPPYVRVVIACDDMRALIATGMPRFQVFTPPAWHRLDLATGHWPMLSVPADLADLLHGLTTAS